MHGTLPGVTCPKMNMYVLQRFVVVTPRTKWRGAECLYLSSISTAFCWLFFFSFSVMSECGLMARLGEWGGGGFAC